MWRLRLPRDGAVDQQSDQAADDYVPDVVATEDDARQAYSGRGQEPGGRRSGVLRAAESGQDHGIRGMAAWEAASLPAIGPALRHGLLQRLHDCRGEAERRRRPGKLLHAVLTVAERGPNAGRREVRNVAYITEPSAQFSVHGLQSVTSIQVRNGRPKSAPCSGNTVAGTWLLEGGIQLPTTSYQLLFNDGGFERDYELRAALVAAIAAEELAEEGQVAENGELAHRLRLALVQQAADHQCLPVLQPDGGVDRSARNRGQGDAVRLRVELKQAADLRVHLQVDRSVRIAHGLHVELHAHVHLARLQRRAVLVDLRAEQIGHLVADEYARAVIVERHHLRAGEQSRLVLQDRCLERRVEADRVAA